MVVVCVGSLPKLPGKSNDSETFSSSAVGQKDHSFLPDWGAALFPSPSLVIEHHNLSWVQCHQSEGHSLPTAGYGHNEISARIVSGSDMENF